MKWMEIERSLARPPIGYLRMVTQLGDNAQGEQKIHITSYIEL